MRTRAERRHNNQRVKRKFYKSLINMDWYDKEWAEWRANFYNTRKPCACWMCRNPRRQWGKRTLQEMKHGYEGKNPLYY